MIANVTVTVGERESLEKAVQRFKNKINKSGLKKDLRSKKFHLTKSQKRKLKDAEAERRHREEDRKRELKKEAARNKRLKEAREYRKYILRKESNGKAQNAG